MKTSRRKFIKSGAMALAASAILPQSVIAAKKAKERNYWRSVVLGT